VTHSGRRDASTASCIALEDDGGHSYTPLTGIFTTLFLEVLRQSGTKGRHLPHRAVKNQAELTPEGSSLLSGPSTFRARRRGGGAGAVVVVVWIDITMHQ
jgi:hypothetical protein